MTKFSIGDRVEFRATTPDTSYAPYGDGDAPTHLNGSRGTIIRDDSRITTCVNWDEGSAARRAFETNGSSRDASNAASFTDNLVLVTESASKPITEGDLVEWLGFVKPNRGEPSRPIGTLGTVDWVPPFNKGTENDTVHVRWDGDGVERGTWLVNIKHAAEPTSAITADSLREQAAAKRTEAADLLKQANELRIKRAALVADADALDTAARTIERLATP